VLGKDTGVIADRLRERGQGAPVAVVIRILLDVLKGLSYVHSARERDGRWLALVHRDVTPGNVLVSYEGMARLADFGLAKSQLTDNSHLTSHGEILGTPHYLAPELVRGSKASPSSDIYGLGAVTYRILTGVAPFTGTTTEVLLKVLNERPRPIADWRPDLPTWFANFVHQLLEPDVKARAFDAALLVRRLEYEADSARLLLPHASVGRWLSALFEEERSSELSEHEAISLLPMPSESEDTRVLATIEVGRGLEGGPALTMGDDAGTELELSSEMFADLSRESRRKAGIEDSRTIGRDPADNQRLLEWGETVGGDEGTPRTPVAPTTDRHDDERTRESRRGSQDQDDRTTEDPHALSQVGRSLPGFADRRPKPVAPEPTAAEEVRTAVTDMELKKLTETSGALEALDDKTAIRVISPIIAPRPPKREDSKDSKEDARLVRPVDESIPPARIEQRGPRVDESRADDQGLDDTRPPEPSDRLRMDEPRTGRAEASVAEKSAVRPLARELLVEPTRPLARRPPAPMMWTPMRLLVSALALIGIGILGAVLALVIARPSTTAEEAGALARFAVLRGRVTEAAHKGEALDARAVEMVSEAAAALVAHDLRRTDKALDELEKILAAPRVAAPP